MKPYHRAGIIGILLCILYLPVARSAVIDAYSGWNVLDIAMPGNGGDIEVQLTDITYRGAGGSSFSVSLPAFSHLSCSGSSSAGACAGMPDFSGPNTFAPTYTTVTGGDGETTRTLGVTLPIDWDTSSHFFPSIVITEITVIAMDAYWTAVPLDPDLWTLSSYQVGLMTPAYGGIGNTELVSWGPSPLGDIYFDQAGDIYGNPPMPFVVTSVSNPIFADAVGTSFGNVTFAAASAVPVPASVWLFVSGVMGMVGIGRYKR